MARNKKKAETILKNCVNCVNSNYDSKGYCELGRTEDFLEMGDICPYFESFGVDMLQDVYATKKKKADSDWPVDLLGPEPPSFSPPFKDISGKEFSVGDKVRLLEDYKASGITNPAGSVLDVVEIDQRVIYAPIGCTGDAIVVSILHLPCNILEITQQQTSLFAGKKKKPCKKAGDAFDELRAITDDINKKMDVIKNHPVYKQILSDSFGGVMYNVANYDKYDATEILALWNNLTASEKDSAGGIMEGVFNFLTEPRYASKKKANGGRNASLVSPVYEEDNIIINEVGIIMQHLDDGAMIQFSNGTRFYLYEQYVDLDKTSAKNHYEVNIGEVYETKDERGNQWTVHSVAPLGYWFNTESGKQLYLGKPAFTDKMDMGEIKKAATKKTSAVYPGDVYRKYDNPDIEWDITKIAPLGYYYLNENGESCFMDKEDFDAKILRGEFVRYSKGATKKLGFKNGDQVTCNGMSGTITQVMKTGSGGQYQTCFVSYNTGGGEWVAAELITKVGGKNKMATRKKADYNGWANWVTWTVSMGVFDDDEAEFSSPRDIENMVRNYVQEFGSFMDIKSQSELTDVDWQELYDTYLMDKTASKKQAADERLPIYDIGEVVSVMAYEYGEQLGRILDYNLQFDNGQFVFDYKIELFSGEIDFYQEGLISSTHTASKKQAAEYEYEVGDRVHSADGPGDGTGEITGRRRNDFDGEAVYSVNFYDGTVEEVREGLLSPYYILSETACFHCGEEITDSQEWDHVEAYGKKVGKVHHNCSDGLIKQGAYWGDDRGVLVIEEKKLAEITTPSEDNKITALVEAEFNHIQNHDLKLDKYEAIQLRLDEVSAAQRKIDSYVRLSRVKDDATVLYLHDIKATVDDEVKSLRYLLDNYQYDVYEVPTVPYKQAWVSDNMPEFVESAMESLAAEQIDPAYQFEVLADTKRMVKEYKNGQRLYADEISMIREAVAETVTEKTATLSGKLQNEIMCQAMSIVDEEVEV